MAALHISPRRRSDAHVVLYVFGIAEVQALIFVGSDKFPTGKYVLFFIKLCWIQIAREKNSWKRCMKRTVLDGSTVLVPIVVVMHM